MAKKANKELTDDAVEARRLGITYGQLQARRYAEIESVKMAAERERLRREWAKQKKEKARADSEQRNTNRKTNKRPGN